MEPAVEVRAAKSSLELALTRARANFVPTRFVIAKFDGKPCRRRWHAALPVFFHSPSKIDGRAHVEPVIRAAKHIRICEFHEGKWCALQGSNL